MHVEVRVGQVGQRIRMAASVASRYALGADGVGAAHPGARGSRVTASRYALGAEGGGAARPGAYMCSPRNCARCLLGGVGMSKTSCAARCSRGSVQGVFRAPAEGEGGVAHREDLAATASATLERSAGTVAHGKRAARERRRRRSKVSRRRRAGRAPPARLLRPQPHSKAAAGTTNTSTKQNYLISPKTSLFFSFYACARSFIFINIHYFCLLLYLQRRVFSLFLFLFLHLSAASPRDRSGEGSRKVPPTRPYGGLARAMK